MSGGPGVAVVGAGAMGCLLAALLSDRGHEVELVGRPDQVAAIRRSGLVLRLPDGSRRVYRLRAGIELAGGPDLVLLTVKTQDVEAACLGIRRAGCAAPVVALQNGIRADELAAGVLGREQVLGGVVVCSASYQRAGEVDVDFQGWLVLGEPFRAAGDRLRGVAAVLGGAVPVAVTRDLAAARWTKLIGNLNNGLCAATGQSASELLRSPLGARLAVEVMREGLRVARAAGQRIDAWPPLCALRAGPRTAALAVLQSAVPALASRAPGGLAAALLAAGAGRMGASEVRGSTWQSLVRGRPTEIDYLNGEIVQLGSRLGATAPLNALVVDAVHEAERTGTFAGLRDLALARERCTS